MGIAGIAIADDDPLRVTPLPGVIADHLRAMHIAYVFEQHSQFFKIHDEASSKTSHNAFLYKEPFGHANLAHCLLEASVRCWIVAGAIDTCNRVLQFLIVEVYPIGLAIPLYCLLSSASSRRKPLVFGTNSST